MKVFALGSNGSGQLGVGNRDDTESPKELRLPASLLLDEIMTIASGGNHTLFLTRSGTMYGTGNNEVGCLSLPGVVECLELRRISLPPIKFCAATWSASIFVTVDDEILTCGHGPKGELAAGKDSDSLQQAIALPNFLPDGVTIVDMSASMGHVLIVLSNGQVYGWGSGRQGQLGAPHQDKWIPKTIDEVSFPVVKTICGKSFSCFFGDASGGKVMLLGNSKGDRFGLLSSFPTRLPGWTQVSASWGGVLALTHDGKLHRFGRDDRGQLGPEQMPHLARISAGSEHAIAITRDGRVLTWGWGEHGNCGQLVDDQKDVKGRYNSLDLSFGAKLVHAGCASSFIVTG